MHPVMGLPNAFFGDAFTLWLGGITDLHDIHCLLAGHDHCPVYLEHSRSDRC